MLLAADTSTRQIGVALCDRDQVIAEILWSSEEHHTVELAPAVGELLSRAGVTMQSMEAFVVATGPGSYTALRVGLALFKGLAVATGSPLIGIGTLDILAAGVPASSMPLVAVLRAGRGRIAVGRYSRATDDGNQKPGSVDGLEPGWDAQGPVELTSVDALARTIERPTLVAGELTREERQRLARKKVNVVLAPPYLCVRRPSLLAALGWKRYSQGNVDEAAALAPTYLRVAEHAQE
jgi:tRNA threonylcarbamoyladenosine biosynthesis protein TsaB